MRRELFALVEAARGLQVHMAPTPANPRNVKVGGDRSDFPARLWELAHALQAFDAVGAAVLDGMSEQDGDRDPSMDSARLRLALDGVFRWMRTNSIDVSEPFSLVSQALGGVAEKKAAKGYRPPAPRFSPSGFRKAHGINPMLDLNGKPWDNVTQASLRDREYQAQVVDNMLGDVSPSKRVQR